MNETYMMNFIKHFSPSFKWGTASSAYQVEGAWNEEGKGASIWDTFSNTPGMINNNETGNTACDHYHRYEEDLELMHQLGIHSYRFSISWPRIFPDGRPDHINPHGVHFYDSLVDTCRRFDIEPIITLFHWDLPQVLEDQGGWFNPQTISYFAAYAAWVCEHFSDRVTCYCTINEPQIISNLGYHLGLHAPGKHLDKRQTVELLHQLARAHSEAVKSMRAVAKQPVQIGFASTGTLCYPSRQYSSFTDERTDAASNEHQSAAHATYTVSAEDMEAARIATFTTNEQSWSFCHQIFCDAVILGESADLTAIGLKNWTDCHELCPPIDFIGINAYNGHEVRAQRSSTASSVSASDSSDRAETAAFQPIIPEFVDRGPGFPRTALKWPVTPEILNEGIRLIYDRYQLPIFICENGLSCNDVVSLDGSVHDPNRIDFLTRYLSELGCAIEAGADVRGYMHWSFTDNFEWHSGYDERFGLVYVDYQTQKRIPKDSFWWYQKLIEEFRHIHS